MIRLDAEIVWVISIVISCLILKVDLAVQDVPMEYDLAGLPVAAGGRSKPSNPMILLMPIAIMPAGSDYFKNQAES